MHAGILHIHDGMQLCHLVAPCPMHACTDIVLSFQCGHAGTNYNGFVGYRGDDGRPGSCSNFEKLNLFACVASALIQKTHAYVATFRSSRGTMPFADRGSMVRLLVDSHLPKVGS